MKLRYLAHIRLPTEKAHGIQIMSMCSAFARAGAEVELVVPTRITHITDDPFAYYGVEKNFSIRKLPTPQPRILGVSFLTQASYLFARYAFARHALKEARTNPADLYYHRDEFTFRFFSNAGLPSVFEVHATPQRLGLYRTALNKAKLVVVITQALQDELVAAGVPKDKILLSPDGVDLKKFALHESKAQARARLGIAPDAFVAMYIGLLDTWKGYQTLLASAALLAKEHVQVVIMGGEEKQLTQLRKEYPTVAFVGYRPYTELPSNQQAADVLVVPNSAKLSIGRDYTSPLKLFAHMTAGVPMLVSDVPALREVVNESQAFFFEPDHAQSLAEEILKIKSQAGEAANKAQAAKALVQKYDWDERAKTILAQLGKM